ncbi:MAG: glycosyltransferase [Oscillochloris sp.]|nr:glycosyltransferase [Oscillochloris sp.]
MRILQVYKDYYPVLGGIENHVRLLAEGMAARGHQIAVLTTARGSRTIRSELGGVPITAVGRLGTFASAPLSPLLPLALAAAKADLIHLHLPDPTGDLAVQLAASRIPLVVTYHSDIVRQRRALMLYGPQLRRTLRRARRVIATSPNYVRSSPFLAPLAERCRVAPLGIDLAPFMQAPPDEVAAIRARFPGPLVLFVGMLRYYKGADRLIRAMAALPDARLLLIGREATVRSGDLQQLAAGLGIADRVHLLGVQESLPAYFHAADVFVLPSVERSEGFGIVQIEAQAAGLPIVATELGTGTSYVTIHGETGIIVPPDNPPALARAIRVLLENPALARSYGESGRRRAQREFSVERMLDRIEAIYREAQSAIG